MSSNFSSEEQEKLREFRERVKDIIAESEEYNDDYYLIRWLRARGLDVSKAEEMLRKSMKWRQDNAVDGIDLREEVPVKYRKIYPFSTLGQDKEGNPVILFPMGRYNHRIVIDDLGLPQFLHFNIIWVERIIRMVKNIEKAQNRKGLRLVQIVDMEGYTYKELAYKPGLDYIMQTQRTFDENYPEMLQSVVIVNAPRVFAILFNLVKPLVSKETQAKMAFHGPNEDEWKAILRERFDVTKIPQRWGGELEGSDPFCSQSTDVWPDGPLPLSFFSRDLASEDEGFIKTKVGARDKLKIEVEVGTKHTELSWKFWTESHDVGFYVEGPGGQKLLDWNRVDAQNEIKEGSLDSGDLLGKYRFVFDNSYSYTKSKILYYLINVGDVN